MTRPSLVFIVVLVTGVLGCKKRAEAPPPQLAAPAAINVAAEDLVTVAPGDIETGPRVSGTLEAQLHATIRAEASGAIVAIGPELGQPVKKGELLARIEAKALGDTVRSSEATVASAQAAVELAQREVERTEALVKGGAAAERDLDRAKASEKTAQAQLGQARAGLASSRSQYADASVTAPMAGVVATRTANLGDVVTMGAPLYELIDPSTMRLAAQVASDELPVVTLGRTVTFEIRGYPGQRFDGTIQRIAPAADPVTRQLPIIVTIPNPSGKLLAGLFAEGRISAELHHGLVVPQAAIDQSGDQPSVLRVKGDVVERVTIALGLRDDRKEVVEVTAGVAAGDRLLVMRAGKRIQAGSKVHVVDKGAR